MYKRRRHSRGRWQTARAPSTEISVPRVATSGGPAAYIHQCLMYQPPQGAIVRPAMLRSLTLFLLVVSALVVGAGTARAQQTDVIRGQIRGPDTQPLRDVNVRVTSYQGGVVKSAKTDKDGRFNVVFLNGEGD